MDEMNEDGPPTKIVIEIPASVAESLGPTAEDRERFVKEAVVIEAYRRGIESKGRLGRIVGVPRIAFESWLAERDVPINETVEEMAIGYHAAKRFLASKV